MGASSSQSESKPVDMTPEAFKALQQPFAQVLGMLINGSGQTINGLVNGYQGPVSAPMGDSENAILAQLMQKTGSNSFMPQQTSTMPTGGMPGGTKTEGMMPGAFPSLGLYDPNGVQTDVPPPAAAESEMVLPSTTNLFRVDRKDVQDNYTKSKAKKPDAKTKSKGK